MTKTSVSSDKNVPLKAICPGIENLIHFNRWHQTIVNQKSFKAVYDPQKFSIEITEKNEDTELANELEKCVELENTKIKKPTKIEKKRFSRSTRKILNHINI